MFQADYIQCRVFAQVIFIQYDLLIVRWHYHLRCCMSQFISCMDAKFNRDKIKPYVSNDSSDTKDIYCIMYIYILSTAYIQQCARFFQQIKIIPECKL